MDLNPERTAYVMAGSGRRISWGELEATSNRMAHLFRDLGLRRGDHIAICLENHPLFLTLCWAAYRSGLYFTAISYRLQPQEVEYIVNDCEAKVLVTSTHLRETFLDLRDRLVNRPVCYMLDGVCEGADSFEDAFASRPAHPIEDQCYGQSMLYSSGTTGRPKGIKKVLPEQPWGEHTPVFLAARDRYGYATDTVYLSPAPLYHSAPLGFTMTVLRAGGSCVIMEHYDSETALALIERYRVTHSQWVPTMFVRMLKLPEATRRRYDLSSLRYAVHAAAPCPVTVKQQMIEWWGPVLYEYYAGTESNGSTFITS